MPDKQLYFRNWKVTIGERGQLGNAYDSLRVVFDIEKTSASFSNKAKIEVYNLNSQSRIATQKKGLIVRLDAGYEGLTETLFIGDVIKVVSKRSGPEIVTTFECGDGERILSESHFEKSYGAGTSYVQIIKDIATVMQVNLGPLVGIPQDVFNKGISFSKSCQFALDVLTKRNKLEWSIQNETLQVMPLAHHNGEEAIVLNKDTGLIGVPSQKESGIEFIALLNPKILPGVPIVLQSTTFTGTYKVRKAKFEGDTHGDKWQVHCEADKVEARQNLPSIAGQFISVNSNGVLT